MTKEEFVEKYCSLCGSQRCEGVDSIWFDGCRRKDELSADTIEEPSVGERVVFCGTVCYVKAVDKKSGILTVEVANPSGSYISYVHATDVDRFLLD